MSKLISQLKQGDNDICLENDIGDNSDWLKWRLDYVHQD